MKASWQRGTWLEIALMAALGGGFLFTVAAVVPWHMDEFLGYHMLACNWYPANMVNVFRSSCTDLGLSLWGDTFLPLRAYTYSGSLPGLLYLPVFVLWPSPMSARLLGLLALAGQAVLLQRLFGIRPAASFIVLLTFLSYSAIQVFDLGPVCLQLTLTIAIYLALCRWQHHSARGFRYTWLWPLAVGAMAFVGCWNKVAFLFVVPSLLLVALAVSLEIAKTLTAPARRRRLVGEMAIGLGAFAGPTLLLFFSRTAAGLPYYEVITGSPVFFTFGQIKQHFVVSVLPFLINPLRSSHLIMQAPRTVPVAGLVLVGLMAVTLTYGFVVARRRHDGSSRRAALLLGAWALVVVLVSASGKSHAAHHVHLGLPLLILAGYELLAPISGRRSVRLLITLFVLLNGGLYYQFVELRHEGTTQRASRDLVALNQELNDRFAERYLIVCVDWGLYYFKSLYGPPEQAVVHFWGLKRAEQLARVQEVADQLGRKLAFVGLHRGSRSDWPLILAGVEGLQQENPAWDNGRWRLAFEPELADQD